MLYKHINVCKAEKFVMYISKLLQCRLRLTLGNALPSITGLTTSEHLRTH